LISGLNGGEWSALRPCRFTPGEETQLQLEFERFINDLRKKQYTNDFKRIILSLDFLFIFNGVYGFPEI
jgi:hypothetical protein